MRKTLAWALTVATAILLLPLLVIPPPATPPVSDAWMDFAIPHFFTIDFKPAPPLAVARQPPPRPPMTPDHVRYKLDPEFGFDNRELHLNGLMLHVIIEF